MAKVPLEFAPPVPRDTAVRHTVVLEQEADGGYVATVSALPGCVSQGDTRPEVLANVREAIELYVEDCRDAGDPVPTEAGREYIEVDAA
jgi:predicted RNase H-like HicB family nuclease